MLGMSVFYSRHRINVTTRKHGSDDIGGVLNVCRRTRCLSSRGSGSDVGSSPSIVVLKPDLISGTLSEVDSRQGYPFFD